MGASAPMEDDVKVQKRKEERWQRDLHGDDSTKKEADGRTIARCERRVILRLSRAKRGVSAKW